MKVVTNTWRFQAGERRPQSCPRRPRPPVYCPGPSLSPALNKGSTFFAGGSSEIVSSPNC
jgi:hypothetical protein